MTTSQSVSTLLRNSWNWLWFNPLDFKKFTALMTFYMTLLIFKAFVCKFSSCAIQWCLIKCELLAAIKSSTNFISPPPFFFYPNITGAWSVAITDTLTKVKENCFNVIFTASYKSRYLLASFNGTKEAISSMSLYLLSILHKLWY